MKAYTDINQSKELAEILPLESADLWWAERYTGTVKENGEYIVNETPFYYRSLIQPSATNYSQDIINDIPCWSLAALLNVLPKCYNHYKSEFRLKLVRNEDDKWCCCYEAKCYTAQCDNPIDACYEMILKLHEQKLL